MSTNEKLNGSIDAIKEQIDKFDSKANILIAIVSIVFAVSLGMLDVFSRFSEVGMTGSTKTRYIILLIFTVLYFVSFAIEMIFLIMVIYPRKKKSSELKALSYYLDANNMSDAELKDSISRDNEEIAINQLRINASICTQKHNYLIKAIWTLIPLFISVFVMFFTSIL